MVLFLPRRTSRLLPARNGLRKNSHLSEEEYVGRIKELVYSSSGWCFSCKKGKEFKEFYFAPV